MLPCISQGDGWVKTTYNGKTGYVSQDYLLVPVTVRDVYKRQGKLYAGSRTSMGRPFAMLWQNVATTLL